MYMCVAMCVVYANVHAGARGGQNRAQEPLELELLTCFPTQ